MKTYHIIVTPDANEDVLAIRNYFVNVRHDPRTAAIHVRAIREEIANLQTMPYKYKVVDDEPWHSRGVRLTLGGKYFVYYRVDEDATIVYILNVVLASRDQLKALAHMDLDW
ncbi:MAG: type II toxin-antitoxin system RelE/ParE family toxin [Oscillospiraceae bacterium]|nr:type II toxin-antitoxin system RelE/ParE family toxin [Oscillospiraceae bacterium]